MANEPLIVGWVEDAIKALGKMSRANGFHYDYAEGVVEGVAVWDVEKDFQRPALHLEWLGEQPQDPNTGAETAAGRSRRYTLWVVSVSVKSDESGVTHWQKGQRMVADIHKALLSTDTALGLNRNRGNGRVTTYDPAAVEWDPQTKGHLTVGGDLRFPFVIRSDHVTGDLGTQ